MLIDQHCKSVDSTQNKRKMKGKIKILLKK